LNTARPAAGDIALGRRFLDEVRPFVWRRYLDFAAIADLRAMKQRMDSHKGTKLGHGTACEQLLGHDVKLGEGGIREVEFCAQVLQLVWGGRAPAVRAAATLEALAAEVAGGYLPEGTRAALSAAYLFLRGVEHRLQMVADRQTHALPSTIAELDRFACFLGYQGAAAFAEVALGQMHAVHAVFGDLFASLPAERAAVPDAAAPDIIAAWLAGRPRAFRTERTKALVRSLLPALQSAVARQPDPAAAMTRLDEFFHRLPAGVQVLSMLHHNPALLDRLADVLGAAPWLADHLAETPAALEGLAAPDVAEAPALRLASLLQDARGLDDALSIAGSAVRRVEFSIAVDEFFGRVDADEAGRRRTALADAVIGECLARALAEHAARYGKVRGGGLAVVALGKAGSGEMMAGSDLDLMLIYDHPADAESRGPKVLPASQYFARAAQAVIGALTVPTRHGPLYQVDMRLRPSGRKGPVAVSLASFTHYHRESAWTWERLALTRARVVAGPARLRGRVEAAIGAALRGADPARVLPDTVEMRARLLRDLPPRGVWDARLRPGGLMETEFIAQALTLLHPPRGRGARSTSAAFEALAGAGVVARGEADMLIGADRFWRTVQGLMRIAVGRQIPATLPPPLLEKLLRATGAYTNEADATEAALRARADTVAAAVQAAFARHVGGFL
jgi:glutamate-ammonia-ligase adenylyltransferase